MIHVQPMTGTAHSTEDCSVARRNTRYGTIQTTVTDRGVDFYNARLCKKCW